MPLLLCSSAEEAVRRAVNAARLALPALTAALGPQLLQRYAAQPGQIGAFLGAVVRTSGLAAHDSHRLTYAFVHTADVARAGSEDLRHVGYEPSQGNRLIISISKS